jgi:hypothetical protein
MHLTIQVLASPPVVETKHVSAERLREVAMYDDRMFALEELEHIKTCGECFKKWEECIRSVPPDQIE